MKAILLFILSFTLMPSAFAAKNNQCSKEQQCVIKGLRKCCSAGFVCNKKAKKCVQASVADAQAMGEAYEAARKEQAKHERKIENASNVKVKPRIGTQPRIKLRSPSAPVLGNIGLGQKIHQENPLKDLPPGNYIRCRDNHVINLKEKEKANVDRCQGHDGVMEFKTIRAKSK